MIKVLRLFLTQEAERQTLPLGKWFLDRKRKKQWKRKVLLLLSLLPFPLLGADPKQA